MAITKIPVELSSTPGIVDNSNATAITIDSSENTTFAGKITLGDGHQIGNDSTDNLVLNSSSAENIVLASAASLFFNTGASSLTSQGTTRVLMSSNGNVGIGNTSPDAMLRIDQDANSVALKVTGGGSGVNIAQFVRDVGADASVAINCSSGEPQIQFNDAETFSIGVNSTYFEIADNGHIGTNTRFVINNTGNVGIGNTSPTGKLHVYDSGTDTYGTQPIAIFDYYDTDDTALRYSARIGDGSTTFKTFVTSSAPDFLIVDQDNTAGRLAFQVQGNAGNIEALAVDSTGKVGIGTTSPGTALQVGDGTGSPYITIDKSTTGASGILLKNAGNNKIKLLANASEEFELHVNNALAMYVKESGNVGIGETNPDAPLHITSNTPIIAYDESDTSQEFRLGVFGGAFALYDSNDTAFRMLVDGNGKVGIGETAPLGKLHVKSADSGQSAADGTADELVIENSGDSGLSILSGTSNYGTILFGDSGDSAAGRIRYEHSHSALNFGTNGSWNRMWISSTGKVGINTTSPDELLQVELGDIKVEGAANASTRGLIIAHTGQTGNLTMLRQDSSGSRGILETTERNLRISAGSGGGTGTAETLDFFVNGSERMMIDTTGNVGIGTSSPHSSAKVHSYTGTTNGQSFHAQGLGGNNFKIVPYCSNGAFSSLTSEDDVCLVAENAGAIVFGHHASGYFGMRVQSNGTINIGTKTEATGSTGGCSFSADTSNRRNFICATTGSGTLELIEFRNPNGTVGTIKTSGSSTSYATSSDYRLKENVNYTWDATTRLKQLKPARFNFKADADITLDGFLAHEVSSVVPQAISGEKDGEKMQEIDHCKLVPLLVKTIQELEARIKVLEDK